MKMACLVSLSTTTKILIYLADDSRCSMKSMEIEFQGFLGISITIRFVSQSLGSCTGSTGLAIILDECSDTRPNIIFSN